MTSPHLTELLALGEWLPAAVGRPVVTVQTEPHVWPRILGVDGVHGAGRAAGVDGVDHVDHVDLRATVASAAASPGDRRAAVRSSTAELRRRVPADGVVVFDTAEGWLTTNLSLSLRRTAPSAIQIGIQHGLFATTGWRTWTPVRRARIVTTDLAHRLVGYAPIGVGFGNLSLDGHLLFGRAFAEFLARVQPRAATRIDFARLQGIAPDEPLTGDADLLFLGQELSGYLPEANSIITRILDRLDRLAADGRRVVARPHPKGDPTPWRRGAGPAVIDTEGGSFRRHLRTDTVVVSFFSTGLLEAASLGCPIVALHHPGLPDAVYGSLADPVPLDRFLDDGDVDAISTVRPGVIG